MLVGGLFFLAGGWMLDGRRAGWREGGRAEGHDNGREGEREGGWVGGWRADSLPTYSITHLHFLLLLPSTQGRHACGQDPHRAGMHVGRIHIGPACMWAGSTQGRHACGQDPHRAGKHVGRIHTGPTCMWAGSIQGRHACG